LDDDCFADDVGITHVSTPSEPSGFRSYLSSSTGDSHELVFFGLDDEDGIHVKTESSPLGSRLSSLDGDLFEHDDHGITPVSSIPSDAVAADSIPSEPPDGLGSGLSSSADGLFERDAFHDNGIGTTPGEQFKNISRLPALANDRFADVVRITPVSIPSEPPDGFEHDDRGIAPVSIPSCAAAADSIPSEPPDGLGSGLSSSADDLFERDAFHDNGIGTTPGEQFKKISRLPALVDDRFADNVGITPVSIPSEPSDGLVTGLLASALGSLHSSSSVGTTPGEQLNRAFSHRLLALIFGWRSLWHLGSVEGRVSYITGCYLVRFIGE
jgi:hypothetical protein